MANKPNSEVREFKIDDLLPKAISTQSGPDIYSNFAQVTMTNNELILDLYISGPIPGNPSAVKITHLQRVVFPHTVAQGLVDAIQTTVSSYQSNHMGEGK